MAFVELDALLSVNGQRSSVVFASTAIIRFLSGNLKLAENEESNIDWKNSIEQSQYSFQLINPLIVQLQHDIKINTFIPW